MKMVFFVVLLLLTDSAWSQEIPSGHPAVDASSESTASGASTGVQNPIMMDAEQALTEFKSFVNNYDMSPVKSLPVQHGGRLKPLDSLARETILFISGKYRIFGFDSIQVFFGLTFSEAGPFLEMIEVRDPEVRKELGFVGTKRRFSLRDLEKTDIENLAQPLAEKEQKNAKLLTAREKAILEVLQQVWATRTLVDGSLFLHSINFQSEVPNPNMQMSAASQAGQTFLRSVSQGAPPFEAAQKLGPIVKAQATNESAKGQLAHMDLEVTYNKLQIFFWTALVLFLLGFIMVSPIPDVYFKKSLVFGLLSLPIICFIFGYYMRITITGFAPVTNMYGTMLWVSLGVIVFAAVLFALYKNRVLTGILLIASSLTLFLTESLPLVLSPGLDPIVAVLRSNYWLTIHVLTITISYAAFSIAMVLGNIALFRKIFLPEEKNTAFFKQYAHYAYRMIQLGVLLITAGIILGGIWADYSWGRFWGWDPKETWALIADVGFIAILHARISGWLRDFGILAASCLAYLLVIMAWYGVNFILAAGLHSYGFSSGGALAVSIFVGVQLLILVAAIVRHLKQLEVKRPA